MESEEKSVRKAMEPLYDLWAERDKACLSREAEIRAMHENGQQDELEEYFRKIEERDEQRREAIVEQIKTEGGWINDTFYRGTMTDEEVRLMGGHEAKVFVGEAVS